MRYRNLDAIAAVLVTILACIAALIRLPVAVTAVLGIALFVATGYILGEALLDHRLGGLERSAVAAGLALIVPVLGGLGLYALGVPLGRPSWTGLMAAVALSGSAALIVRRRINDTPATSGHSWSSTASVRNCALFGLAALITGGAVLLARDGVARQHYAGFTQLWISPGGDSNDVIGVTNREGRTATFRLVVDRTGQKSSVYDLVLRQGQTWRHAVSASGQERIVADLYRLPVLSTPYRSVDTSGGPS